MSRDTGRQLVGRDADPRAIRSRTGGRVDQVAVQRRPLRRTRRSRTSWPVRLGDQRARRVEHHVRRRRRRRAPGAAASWAAQARCEFDAARTRRTCATSALIASAPGTRQAARERGMRIAAARLGSGGPAPAGGADPPRPPRRPRRRRSPALRPGEVGRGPQAAGAQPLEQRAVLVQRREVRGQRVDVADVVHEAVLRRARTTRRRRRRRPDAAARERLAA